MKDCTTCKYGFEDDHWGIPMCHHPKRFSEDCVDFNMHEEKEIKESKKSIPNVLEKAAEEYAKTTFNKPYSDNPDEEITIVEPDKYAGFIAGAKWGARHAKQLSDE